MKLGSKSVTPKRPATRVPFREGVVYCWQCREEDSAMKGCAGCADERKDQRWRAEFVARFKREPTQADRWLSAFSVLVS